VLLLDTLRGNIGQIRLSDPELRVTISVGLATGEGTSLLDEVLARADTALYKAKNSGRDLVCYAQESFDTASTAVRRTLRQK
jgi:PleD family two-component response regulator